MDMDDKGDNIKCEPNNKITSQKICIIQPIEFMLNKIKGAPLS